LSAWAADGVDEKRECGDEISLFAFDKHGFSPQVGFSENFKT